MYAVYYRLYLRVRYPEASVQAHGTPHIPRHGRQGLEREKFGREARSAGKDFSDLALGRMGVLVVAKVVDGRSISASGTTSLIFCQRGGVKVPHYNASGQERILAD